MQHKNKKQTGRLILGLDPGTALTGFGLIRVEDDKLQFVECGCIRTPSNLKMPERLRQIAEDLEQLICEYRPDEVAVEQLFFFRNVTTAISVGQARGVMLVTACRAEVPVFEYTPLQVKQTVTGYGKADKKQVQAMVKMILDLKTVPKPDDAADALAIAITQARFAANTELKKQKT